MTLIWALLAAAVFVPIAAAAASPLLEWRGPVYILAGFAGIIALGFMLVQPLLIPDTCRDCRLIVDDAHIIGSEARWS